MHQTRRGGWAWRFLGQLGRAWTRDKIPFLASAITFDALLAAVPFVLVLLAVVGYFVSSLTAGNQVDLHRILENIFPARTGTLAENPFDRVERLLSDVAENRGTLSAYGIPLFIVLSARMFTAVRTALNVVFHTEDTRPWLKGKAVDLLLVALTGTLLLGNTIVSVRWGVVGGGSNLDVVAGVALQVASAFTLFITVYKIAPTRPITWSTALVGGMACTVVFEIAKRLYGLYLRQMVQIATVTVGVRIGAITFLVIWVYVMAIVFLIGAEIAEAYHQARITTPTA